MMFSLQWLNNLYRVLCWNAKNSHMTAMIYTANIKTRFMYHLKSRSTMTFKIISCSLDLWMYITNKKHTIILTTYWLKCFRLSRYILSGFQRSCFNVRYKIRTCFSAICKPVSKCYINDNFIGQFAYDLFLAAVSLMKIYQWQFDSLHGVTGYLIVILVLDISLWTFERVLLQGGFFTAFTPLVMLLLLLFCLSVHIMHLSCGHSTGNKSWSATLYH